MDKREELTQIVKEFQKDKRQFELLYSKIINKLYYWCFSIVGNEAVAKDMTQDVMIRIYNKIDKLDTPEYFTTWMYRIARNHCLNYLRNNKSEFEFLYDSHSGESTEKLVKEERADHIPHEAYSIEEQRKLIVSFVNNLPKRQKEVVTLHYLEEMKMDEIAEILDYNVGSVKSRLHSARKNLKQQIEEYQNTHNIKLHSVTILPLLGLLLQEDADEVCNKQDLGFNKNAFKVPKVPKLVSTISKGLFVSGSLTTVVAVVVFAIMATNAPLSKVNQGIRYERINSQENEEVQKNETHITDVETFNEKEGNRYIESIIYDTFPNRTNINVRIKLKKVALDDDIKMMFDNQEIPFKLDEQDIYVQAKENGNYIIVINDKRFTFTIDKIDRTAPEVIGLEEQNNYLQLIVNDEKAQIDYDKSYLEYQGSQYHITKDNKVYGEFEGMFEIYIFNDEDQYVVYQFDINRLENK